MSLESEFSKRLLDFGIAGLAIYFMYRLADRAIAHVSNHRKTVTA